METQYTNHTLQEKALKLKKQRRRQILASLLGIAILAWGIVEVACLFLDYKHTETSNDAQIEQYNSPVNLRASGYIKKTILRNTRMYVREIPCWCWMTVNIVFV